MSEISGRNRRVEAWLNLDSAVPREDTMNWDEMTRYYKPRKSVVDDSGGEVVERIEHNLVTGEVTFISADNSQNYRV